MSDLPDGWEKVTLPHVAAVLDTHRVPINADERNQRIAGKAVDSLVPYYGATGQVGWIDDALFDENLVLLGEDGAPFLDPQKPKAYLVTGKSWVNNHAHVLRAQERVLDWRLLAHQLNSIDYTGFVTGTTRPKLTQGAMNTLPILVPPFQEQTRIADQLDKLLARTKTCNDRLDAIPALLKRFRQAVLSAATSGALTEDWRTGAEPAYQHVSLGALISDGPQNGLYKHSSSYGTGTGILRIDMFYDGEVTGWGVMKRLKVDASELATYGLSVGDIVVNRVNSPPFVGKAALIRELAEPTVFESNMMRIRVDNERILPEYCIRFLSSPEGLSQLRRNVKHAVNQSSINQTDVKSVQVPLPCLAEQAEIVRRVKALLKFAEHVEARYTFARAKAQRLAPLLLAKAFRGELVPQDPNDEPASALLERIHAAKAEPSPKSRRGRQPKVAHPDS